jgi:hypothetical protein
LHAKKRARATQERGANKEKTVLETTLKNDQKKMKQHKLDEESKEWTR